jgi:hypothetical protein
VSSRIVSLTGECNLTVFEIFASSLFELRLKLLEGLHNVKVSLFVHPFKSMLKILSLNPSL